MSCFIHWFVEFGIYEIIYGYAIIQLSANSILHSVYVLGIYFLLSDVALIQKHMHK